MADQTDYQFAQLRPELVQRIKQLETELSNELDEPVILLAFDKQKDAERNAVDSGGGIDKGRVRYC